MFSSIHLIADATLATESVAQAVTAEQLQTVSLTTSNVWMLVSTMLVFIMALGFACVEAGFTQAKNTVNILFKNTVDLSVGIISYAWFGFNLMYPGEFNGVFGFSGWGISLPADYTSLGYAGGAYTYWTDFLFQAMFAATCATIVSGAVAERIKISAYFIFTFFLVGFVYPVLGSWHWGGGWLSQMGFYDFAGSTVVHSVGGWAALAGIIAIGARKGKYVNGKVIDKPGSSVPLAVIGVFLLWFGWFGFNGGSVLSADAESISLVLVTTTLAAAAGAIGGWLGGYIMFKRFDLGMVLNGILAGLVGITAGADQMSPNESILIGLVCGVIVVFSAVGMDKLKLDDCVGAVSVHLTCGIIGTLAIGVLGQKAGFDQFITQLTGVAAYGAVAFTTSLALFFALKFTIGVRVSEEHENEGLDSHEHGIRGYTITFDN
ncbi:ammonium transporter [Flammeovirga agarivorans]|uniref:Ammonium transporter n=1 Tax=Flammeovirga agarivorans TaxID=2726742 RepID=A0A7X8SH17_9BACT|nr:ammonium transporter [Flammeovirga agarivorans]NLR90029.1 ammonium transporter [Flammeovirga agarivorans]